MDESSCFMSGTSAKMVDCVQRCYANLSQAFSLRLFGWTDSVVLHWVVSRFLARLGLNMAKPMHTKYATWGRKKKSREREKKKAASRKTALCTGQWYCACKPTRLSQYFCSLPGSLLVRNLKSFFFSSQELWFLSVWVVTISACCR